VLPEFTTAGASAAAMFADAFVSGPSVSVSYFKIITQRVMRNSENLMYPSEIQPFKVTYKKWGQWKSDKGLNNTI